MEEEAAVFVDRGDHGIDVTKRNSPKLSTSEASDFGDNGNDHQTKAYALYLWGR